MEEQKRIAEEQAALWNGRAGQAWVDAQEVLDRMFQPFEAPLLEAALGAAEAAAADGGASPSGRQVLDVGCGTGATTLAVAARLGGGAAAVGVDLSAPMIELARQRAQASGAAGAAARFVVADAQTHPFEAASFDAIISRFGVMFFETPVAAFANLRRAARPGARLRCIAWRSPAENPFMTTAERAAAPLLPALPARRPDGPGQFAFADREGVRGILEASGWSELSIAPLDVTCELPERELPRYVTRLGPVGMALHEADEATRQRVIAAVLAAFAPFRQGDVVRYTAACWQLDARAR